MDDGLVYEDDGLPNKGDGSAHHQWPKNRIFDGKMRNQCWQKADVVPGRHPERWRKDVAGNIVCRRLTRCEGCLCYEYDHVRPFSKGIPSLSAQAEASSVESPLSSPFSCLLVLKDGIR